MEKTGERSSETEVHRIKGDLLLLSSKPSEAETSFRQAIAVARRQEAKSWELRRQILSEIYGWFTEGFDTPDLQEAKALLDALTEKGRESLP